MSSLAGGCITLFSNRRFFALFAVQSMHLVLKMYDRLVDAEAGKFLVKRRKTGGGGGGRRRARSGSPEAEGDEDPAAEGKEGEDKEKEGAGEEGGEKKEDGEEDKGEGDGAAEGEGSGAKGAQDAKTKRRDVLAELEEEEVCVIV